MPTTTVKHVKINKGKGGNLKFLKKIPPWGWLLIAGGVVIFFIWYRAQQAKSAATASDQNAGATASQVGTDSYLAGYQDAMSGSGGGYYGGGGGGYGGLGYIDSATLAGLAGWGPINSTNPSGSSSSGDTTGNSPVGNPAGPVTVNVQMPAVSTGGGPPNRPDSHGGTGTPTIAQYNQQFLAPGAKAPTYRLVRPAKYPHAMWAGPHKPGTNWVGVGGGWWIKK